MASQFVLLDTDVFSYLLRGDERGKPFRRYIEGKTVAISFITVGELYFGASNQGWGQKKLSDLERAIKAAVIVPYDLELC